MILTFTKEEQTSLLYKLMEQFSYGFKTDIKPFNLKDIIKDEAKSKYENATFSKVRIKNNVIEDETSVEQLTLKLNRSSDFRSVMATPLLEEDNVRFFYKDFCVYGNPNINSGQLLLQRNNIEGYATVDFTKVTSYKGLKEAYIKAKKEYILQGLSSIFITDEKEVKKTTNNIVIYIKGIDINDVDFNKIPIV